MKEYTRGKWEQGGQVIYKSDGRAIIATVNYIGFETEGKANARLIAAAPDLYKACNEATMWVAKMSADGSTIAGRVLTRMRKALAKVES